MNILFTLEAQIQGKSVKIEVQENLDIFTIARSIAIEHDLGQQAEEQIMVVILETLTEMMDSTDIELKKSICKLLNNTVKKETKKFEPRVENERRKDETVEMKKSREKRGCTLYDRALKLKQQKKKVAEEVKGVKQKQEVKECTFQPQVNSYPFLERSNTHEILYKNAKMVKQKQERIRRTRQDQQRDGCSFKPEINENSLKLVKNKPQNNSFKRIPYHQEHTHQPNISKGSQKIASHFPDFNKRLQRYMHLKKQAICERQREKQNSFVSKAEKCQKDKYRQIFDDEGRDQERRMKLYGMLQGQCKHEQESQLSINNSVIINSRSEELFLKKKIRAFELIFDNVECDGIVNEDTVEYHNLSEQIYVILEPLLSQIAELQVSLNKQQFINSLQRLYSGLGTIQKQMLINRQTKRKWELGHQQYRNQYKFRPTISQKSKDLAGMREIRPLRPLEPRRKFQNEQEQELIIQRYMRDNYNRSSDVSDTESDEEQEDEDSPKKMSQENQDNESRFTIEEEEDQEGESDIELI